MYGVQSFTDLDSKHEKLPSFRLSSGKGERDHPVFYVTVDFYKPNNYRMKILVYIKIWYLCEPKVIKFQRSLAN